jgi:hypothetical protein
MRSTFAAAIVSMLVTSASRSQTFVREPLPRAPGARISTITAPGPFTEPGIAIDRRDSRRAVGVYQNQAMAAWTADAGVTWTAAEGTAPPHYRVAGDVSVAIVINTATRSSATSRSSHRVTSYWALAEAAAAFSCGDPSMAARRGRRTITSSSSIRGNRALGGHAVHHRSPKAHRGNLYIGWIQFRGSTVMFFTLDQRGDYLECTAGPSNDLDCRATTGGLVVSRGGRGRRHPHATWHDGKASCSRRLAMEEEHSRSKRVIRRRRVFQHREFFSGTASQHRHRAEAWRLYVSWGDYRKRHRHLVATKRTAERRGPPTRVNDDPMHGVIKEFMQWVAVDPRWIRVRRLLRSTRDS